MVPVPLQRLDVLVILSVWKDKLRNQLNSYFDAHETVK